MGRAWFPESQKSEHCRVNGSHLEVVEDPVGERGGVIVVVDRHRRQSGRATAYLLYEQATGLN
ncbi:hypothetical protein AB0F88_28535 [Streptosporangium sp. NPDC023963]|uniref:hypothetical protein n=1 Tax=Streptosporangium sp. NPDC023963 TaxID=3155608 RepID=UPI00341AFDF6